ncbi:hypothetical protein QZH41_011198, partial [Actinostola sp. cb2023]
MIYEYLTFTIHRLQAVTMAASFFSLYLLSSLLGSSDQERWLAAMAIEWRGKYGPIVSVNLDLVLAECVLVFDKDLIKQVLVTDSYKFNRDQLIKDALPGVGNGLFGSNGKTHARQRKDDQSCFQFYKFEDLWTKKIEISPIVEVDDDICHLTLDIIGKTSFWLRIQYGTGTGIRSVNGLNSLLTGTEFSYLVRSKIIPFYKYLPFPDNLAIKKSTKLVDDTVLKVIQERGMFQGKAADHKDLLNLLLDMYDEETGKGFLMTKNCGLKSSRSWLLDMKTTSTSMSWTLYELAKHPENTRQNKEGNQ